LDFEAELKAQQKSTDSRAKQPMNRRYLLAMAAAPVGNPPEQFSAFVDSEIRRWAQVVKFSGAKPE
jgi:hypothetical protein